MDPDQSWHLVLNQIITEMFQDKPLPSRDGGCGENVFITADTGHLTNLYSNPTLAWFRCIKMYYIYLMYYLCINSFIKACKQTLKKSATVGDFEAIRFGQTECASNIVRFLWGFYELRFTVPVSERGYSTVY